jgi:hypothetical protein
LSPKGTFSEYTIFFYIPPFGEMRHYGFGHICAEFSKQKKSIIFTRLFSERNIFVFNVFFFYNMPLGRNGE